LTIFIVFLGTISLIFSTVYLRYHWVVDIFAGTGLALFSIFLADKSYSYWAFFRKRSSLPELEVPWLKEVKKIGEQGSE